jgi:hypothetical protein
MYGVALVCVGIFMPGGLMRANVFASLSVWSGFSDHYGYHPSQLLRIETGSRK